MDQTQIGRAGGIEPLRIPVDCYYWPREPFAAYHERTQRWAVLVNHLLYAGSSLDKTREVFAAAIYHRPRIRLTIRQRTHVLEQWPKAAP
jgi:hypothetical protein